MYYGGNVELYRDYNSDLYAMQHVELTFKPIEPLIDGSVGKTLTLCGGEKSNDRNFIMDIQIGRDTISAKYKPTGQALRVRNILDDSDDSYADSITVDFCGIEFPERANSMTIGVK